jgi:hypothetical protein
MSCCDHENVCYDRGNMLCVMIMEMCCVLCIASF